VRAARYCLFGSFVLDRLDERLWKGSMAVPLGNKAFAVLDRLTAQPNQLVTKDELLSAVWPDTAVSEAVLTTAARDIRAAIEDDARTPRFLETVYGRGYRFIGRVECAEVRPDAGPSQDGSLVGRDAERARLHDLFADVLRRHDRRLALIAGEAGIGKTALVDAVTEALSVSTGMWVARGQCVDQYGAGEAYMPLVEALFRLSREAGAAVIAPLRDHAPDWAAHLSLVDSPLHTSGSRVRPDRMLRELAQAVEAIAAARPLVLVLEDLQWSDRATLDWLAYVVRRRDPARLLILGTYRPPAALLHCTPLRDVLPELRNQPQTTEIVLDYLTRDAIRMYVRQRCGDHLELDDMIDVFQRRTGGHPFLLAGITDDLVQRARTAGNRPDLRSGASAFPSTVRQFVEDRIQRLADGDRIILEAASIVGEQFSTAAVAAVTGRVEEEVEARCAALTQHDRILIADAPSISDGAVSPRYRFRHALLQDATYLGISPERRARLHLAVGLQLETTSGSLAASFASALAVHFDEGRDPERAINYREQAARNAVQRAAYHDAEQHLSRALVLTSSLPATSDRLQREAACSLLLAQVLQARRGWGVEEVRREYARAHDLCTALGDSASLLKATWGLIAASVVRAEYAPTQSLAKDLLRLAKRRGDEMFRMAAHAELAGSSLLLGRAASACRHFAAAEKLSAGDRRPYGVDIFGVDMRIFAGMWATHATWYLGYPDRARRRATELLNTAESIDHPFTQTIALAYAAMLAQFCGDRQDVCRLADAAIAHASEHDFPYYRAWAVGLRGWTLASDPGGVRGIDEIRDAIAMLQSTAGTRLPYYRALLAEACAATGRVDEGLTVLVPAFEEVEKTGERWWEPELHRIRGELLRQSMDRCEAEECFRTAMDVASRRGARALRLRAAVGLTRMLRGSADEKHAHALLAEARNSFTEGFSTPDMRTAHALLESWRGSESLNQTG